MGAGEGRGCAEATRACRLQTPPCTWVMAMGDGDGDDDGQW